MLRIPNTGQMSRFSLLSSIASTIYWRSLVPKPKKRQTPEGSQFLQKYLILVISCTFLRKVLPFSIKAKYMQDFLEKNQEREIQVNILVQLIRAPIVLGMNEGTIKTPNPKCRLYWRLIEFINWRYSQSCWYFRPLLWTIAPLPSPWPPPPLPPSQSKRTVYTDSVWLWAGGGMGGVELCWRPYSAGV